MTNQEVLYQLQPPNGAQPKWNRPGRPLPVIEEPRAPGVWTATGGMDGSETNGGGMKAPVPKLPPPRQDRLSAGVVTSPRKNINRHGGFRAPETRLPNKGTGVASQVFTEARDRDVVPDRRNVPWSPENVLIDTVDRLQRDLNDMRAESRFLRTPGSQMLCQPPDM